MSEIKNYIELKKQFTNIKIEYRAVPFYHLDGDISDYDEVSSQLNGFKKSGYGGVIPLPVGSHGDSNATFPKYGSDDFYEAYKNILDKSQKLGMKVIYYDDLDFPTGWAGGELAEKYPDSQSKIITMLEYECATGETIKKKLDVKDKTLALVAMELETFETIDLSKYVEKEYVIWDVPDGNWNIMQFICKPNPQVNYVNYLDYNSSMDFINLTYKRFTDKYEAYIGDVVNMTFYDDIQYKAENRRMWTDDFNETFISEYGFSPSLYYPALYKYIGDKTSLYKAMFMNCRAKMLVNGFFKAVSDFTQAHGLISTGHVAEPKTTAVSWLFGDAMLFQKIAGAPGLDLVHSYMYGFNGLKIVSSSAYNFDKEITTCEIYGNYAKLDKDIMYREAMNAFARGINYLIPHTLWYSGKARIPHEVSHRNPEYKDMLPAFNDFVARVQTLLRGGRHICDIAILYPIYSLHSQVYLFEQISNGFEFPQTPENADYMNVINTIMNYSGKDVTVLHPETVTERCYTENGILYLNNSVNYEQYKVLVLPGCSMISVKNLRVIKKFFDDGGAIIATTELPFKAYEYDKNEIFDKEVCDIIHHIFGIEKDNKSSIKEFYKKTNEKNGVSYFINSAATAADGTDIVSSPLLNEILYELNIAYDIEIENMLKIENSGILNVNLPTFYNMKVHEGVKSGGVFNHIHKKYANCDIYYFANSTNMGYDGSISLKGKLTPEQWNPYNGKIHKLDCVYCELHGETYTKIKLKIDSINSVFIVCK